MVKGMLAGQGHYGEMSTGLWSHAEGWGVSSQELSLPRYVTS